MSVTRDSAGVFSDFTFLTPPQCCKLQFALNFCPSVSLPPLLGELSADGDWLTEQQLYRVIMYEPTLLAFALEVHIYLRTTDNYALPKG